MAYRGTNHKGGRPKGKKAQKTIEREEALKQFRERIVRVTGKLQNAQLSLAYGQQFLYVITTHIEGKKRVKDKPKLVTDPDVIRRYLNGEYDDSDDEFYYITTKEPDNKALDSLLDRTYGKAKENLNVKHSGLSLRELYEASQRRKNGSGEGETPQTNETEEEIKSS